MNIVYHEKGKVFHLFNDSVSYIFMVLPHGGLGSLYYGKALRDREGFEHIFERVHRGMTACVFADTRWTRSARNCRRTARRIFAALR